MIYAFEAYTLDTDRYELRRAGKLCPLEPHALDILAYLLEHRDRVVTKHELLEHLWPNRFVGEGILAQRLMTIRKAIGDSGRSQHCIKTLHGRGYRFAASVAVHTNAAAFANVAAAAGPTIDSDHVDDPVTERPGHSAPGHGVPPRLFSRPPYFVGRDAELTQLVQWWSTAQSGIRQIGFIVGEPGIGKTALVDTFVAQVVATGASSVGRGQCVDDYGTGEPYLPVLEALGRLCRSAERSRFLSALRRYAPSWLAHLPSALTTADSDAVRATHGVTPDQMLRELTDALEVLTQTRPLVLVLEDLHWSDRATLAWLAYMARRRDPARVLILATYRPGELLGHENPLRAVLAELQPQPQCVELVVEALPAPAVAAYVSQRCAVTLPANALEIIHHRTSGHPLFLVAIVDELVRDKLFEATGEAVASQQNRTVLGEIPTNLQQYVEQHLQRLSDEDQMLLEAASMAGSTFTVAAVAAGVAQAPETIETRYTALARQGRFIRASGSEIWPDGTMTACYEFKHALYYEVVYARVSAGQRLHLHQQIGARKEAGYGAQAPEIAAELAVHFARGGDAARAVQYLDHAAAIALRRSAYDTAIAHLTQGLDLLRSLPDTAERAQHELSFLSTLGLALVATKGQAHVEVESTFVRARELCHRLGDSPQLSLALGGLLGFYVVRSQLKAAWNVGEQLLALAERQPDTPLRVVAHWALGQTLLFQGALIPARAQLERGIALYEPQAPRALGLHAGFPGDLGVFCRCFAAHTLWHLGYPDQALRRIREALSLAEELAHPFSRALALAYAAMLYQFRREQALAHEAAETAMTLCREQGFAYYLAWVTIMKGWAQTAQGIREQGMVQMRQGMAAIRATGAELRQPYYRALLAGAYGEAGQVESGLALLAEGLTEAHRHNECWQEAELHRLRGELLLRAGVHATRSHADGDADGIYAGAEQCFQQALATARRQEAKSLELRAAVNLARLWQQKGHDAKARDVLAPVYAWFTEGFHTADLRDARALLDEMG
jgi:predicted ATPase/DNA-binding winged helix-turn-helix (wHTH) protein